ncbi:MAG: protein kinase, partial [Melioribacteraceae bacterium]|nr:protein kinase [Melioribacteraceae bacterium]
EIDSFNNEFKIIKNLNHPNIISAFDKGTILKLDDDYKSKFMISENDKFMTLERIDGVQFNKCSELKDESKLINIIKQISLALQYIHQSNYIYFDLKPENILIANISGVLKVELIDFGLARYVPNLEGKYFKGSAEYLAPEILKKEGLDYRVDFYSFGILLYHLAYQRFPFRTGSQLEIYRAHIEKEFQFPSCKYSSKIIKIIRKLLSKNPNKRYTTSLEIIDKLGLKISYEEKINLNTALTYFDGKDSSKKLFDYTESDTWGKICTLVGKRGSGKSCLLENLTENSPRLVHIKTNNFISASNFWQQFFSRLLFNEKVFKSVDDSLIQYVSLHIDDNSEDLLVELKTIISKIASNSNFVLLIDDFDKFEAHNIELLLQLFPILLANQIKIILGISDISKIEFDDNFERETITLKPFNDYEITNVINQSFYKLVPHSDMVNLIISFSEREPAAISDFLSQLIIAKIISFSNNRFEVKYDDAKITSLLTSQNKIFEVILQNLSVKEIKILEIISLFQVEISSSLITAVLETDFSEIQITVNNLRVKNILHPTAQTRNTNFVNEGFKKFIYSKINGVCDLHYKAGKVVLESFPDMNMLNKVRQFELAKRFEIADEIINSELNTNNIKNFPQLKRKLLQKKISYEFNEFDKINLTLKLIAVEISLGNYNIAIKLNKELSNEKLDENQKTLKNKYLGIVLIKTGEIKEGINLLIKIIDSPVISKNEIYLEIAGAYIEINNYNQTDLICKEIINAESDSKEIIGRAQNLLGISNLYNKSDLNITLKYFSNAHETYSKSNNFIRIAGSEVNLGNVQNILGNYSKAEKHWSKALQLNQSIGNVEQEANVLLNSGIFYYEHSYYEKAMKVYNKAGNIFKGLGNKMNFGLVNINLGEVYLEICEYQKSLEVLSIAERIFIELNNNDELIEVYFLLTRLFINVENTTKANEYFKKAKTLKSENTKREELLLKFVETLDDLSSKKEINFVAVKSLMDNLFSSKQKLIATDVLFILTKSLIINEEFKKAIKLLNSKRIIDVASFNNKYNANRLYLLSKIPLQYQIDPSFTKIFLLLKGYAILQNGSISELTINVLNDLAYFYFDRGHITNAKEYALIGKTIVDYIESKTELSLAEKYIHLNTDFNRILTSG